MTKNESHGTPRRVLVVDDVPMNVKVISAMVKKLGYEVFALESPVDALAVMAREHVDVVLTDLWMLEMSGIELAQVVRVKYPEVRVIAITADTEAEHTLNFDHSIFDTLIFKPVTIEKIRALL